jgi:carboxypeptidase Taq
MAVLSTVEGILHWDMETMMPPKAVEQRSQQLALLSRIHHKMGTHPEIGKLLDIIQANPNYQELNQEKQRNVHLINKSYIEQKALPEKLVSDIAMQQAVTTNIWKKAKAKKDFNLYKEDLQKLLNLTKQAAEILMKVKKTKTPYEALIDNYEPNMSAETIGRIFNQLLISLRPLINQIKKHQLKSSIINQNVPTENQRKIAQLITQTLGYDTASSKAIGRVDETEHPFTSGYYDDIRITTHYHPNSFTNSIFSVLHESGHAIYEQNLNPKWKYQPIGTPCSYGIHESQSRFYENVIGRSLEFWTSFFPKMKQAAPMLSNLKLNDFVHEINKVRYSKIRIEADEVTYNLHIIVRFELEQALFADKIEIDELPHVWNQKCADYLGVEITNDAEGVMQDTHWASGLYGYFPSYALGNIYDGQITAALTNSIPNWRTQLTEGNMGAINEWLKKKFHNLGNLYDPEELIKQATGTTLNSQPYLNYLNEKYRSLYGF